MLPKIVHQTIPNRSKLGTATQRLMNRQKLENPNWKFILYDNGEILNFIFQYFPQYLQTYLRINPNYGASRADFFRYLVMYEHGGIWLDSKSALPPCFDNHIGDEEFIYELSPKCPCCSGQSSSPCDRIHGWWKDYDYFPEIKLIKTVLNYREIVNYFFAVTPKSILLKNVIDHVVLNIESGNYDNDIGKEAVLIITGPVAFTNAILKNLKDIKSKQLKTDTILYRDSNVFPNDYQNSKPHYSTLSEKVLCKRINYGFVVMTTTQTRIKDTLFFQFLSRILKLLPHNVYLILNVDSSNMYFVPSYISDLSNDFRFVINKSENESSVLENPFILDDQIIIIIDDSNTIITENMFRNLIVKIEEYKDDVIVSNYIDTPDRNNGFGFRKRLMFGVDSFKVSDIQNFIKIKNIKIKVLRYNTPKDQTYPKNSVLISRMGAEHHVGRLDDDV